MKAYWVWVVFLFSALSLVLYLPAINGGWYLDDYQNIVLNDTIKFLPDALKTIISSRGLSYFSFALDYQFWGLSPKAYRINNVLIHVINSLLVVVLCREVFTDTYRNSSIFLGLFFLCHPLQTSAVNYVVQRMTLLSSMFALLSLVLLCKYFKIDEKHPRYRKIIVLCCAVGAGLLSAFSKENTVLLPCLVPFFAWILGQNRIIKSSWKPVAVAYAIIPVTASLARVFSDVDTTLGALSIVPLYMESGADFYLPIDNRDFLPLRYLVAQGEVVWLYLRLIFFPLQQAFDYNWPIPPLEFRLLPILSFFLIGMLWAVFYKWRRKYPYGFLGLNWVLLFTAVESTVIPLDPVFEHRLYILFVGVFFIVIEQLFLWVPNKKWLSFCAIALMVFCATLSLERNIVFGGSEKDFWAQNVHVVPKAPRPQNWLATMQFRDKDFLDSAKRFDKLGSTLESTAYSKATGEAYYFAGEKEKAFNSFVQFKKEYPNDNSYEVFSAFEAAQKDQWAVVEKYLLQAKEKDHDDMRIPYLRAMSAHRKKDYYNAAINAQKVIELWGKINGVDIFNATSIGYVEWAQEIKKDSLAGLSDWLNMENGKLANTSTNISARVDFAGKLLQIGLLNNAEQHYLFAIALAPNAWSIYYNLGLLNDKKKEFKLAERYYLKALSLSSHNQLVLENIAELAFRREQLQKAEKYYRKITSLWPLSGKGWLGLGRVLELARDYDGARECYVRAAQSSSYSLTANRDLKRLSEKITRE